MAATRDDGWSSDVTDRALAWLNLGDTTGQTKGDDIGDLDMVMDSCRSIVREIPESAHSWDSEGDRNRELACVRDNME